MAYITATYQLTARDRLEQRAEQLALGLTVGSWTELNHLEQQQLASFKGEVVHTEERDGKGYITIRYPEHNVSRDFSAILTTVFGKLSLDGEIKLTELAITRYIYVGLSRCEIRDRRGPFLDRCRRSPIINEHLQRSHRTRFIVPS